MVEKIYYFLVVEGTNAPTKSKEFRKVAYHLPNDPRGTQGTLACSVFRYGRLTYILMRGGDCLQLATAEAID